MQATKSIPPDRAALEEIVNRQGIYETLTILADVVRARGEKNNSLFSSCLAEKVARNIEKARDAT